MTAVPAEGDDAAWVDIQAPIAAEKLGVFCADVERLFRINPYLEFRAWEALAGDRFRAEVTNLSNGRRMTLEMRLERRSALAFRVHYASGVKRSTSFEIRPQPEGSSLRITDDYSPRNAGSPDASVAEVDRSLHAWGVALHDYLRLEHRFGWLPLWHAAARHLWLPMKPSARRIARLVVLIAMAEFVFFLLVALIYALEQGR